MRTDGKTDRQNFGLYLLFIHTANDLVYHIISLKATEDKEGKNKIHLYSPYFLIMC
jgi:hypothetical protein